MLRTTLTNHVRRVRKAEGGFTLIELLIVIVVLGVLAGIVVFGVGTFKTDSEAAAKAASCKTVSVAAEAWSAKFGSYPTSAAALVTAGYLKAPVPAGIGASFATDGTPAGC
jgi:general secretion pathway protein G